MKAIQINLNYLWAESGDVTDPDLGNASRPNYLQGWQAEIPTSQEFNFVLNTNANNILYLAERGAYEYDPEISYAQGAMVHSGGRVYYSKSDSNVGQPLTNKARWVAGYVFGKTTLGAYSNTQGLLISDIGEFTSSTIWQGSDLTVKSAVPLVSFESTGAGGNWLLGNIEGEMCVNDLGNTGMANNKNIAKSSGDTYRLYHEGHKPTQAEIPGTIPDAPSNANSYVRMGGSWVVSDSGMGDAPSNGKQYARKDADWEEVEDVGNRPGDIKATTNSAATMLARGWLPCNGRPVSRTTYSNLYGSPTVGGLYGDGDGINTFNTPNIPSVTVKSKRWVTDPFFNGTSNVNSVAIHQASETVYALTSQTSSTAVGTASLFRRDPITLTWAQYSDVHLRMGGAVELEVDQSTGDVYIGYGFGGGVRRIDISLTTGSVLLVETTDCEAVGGMSFNTTTNTLTISNTSSSGDDNYYYNSDSGVVTSANDGNNFWAMCWSIEAQKGYGAKGNGKLYESTDGTSWAIVPVSSSEPNSSFNTSWDLGYCRALCYDSRTNQIITHNNYAGWMLGYDVETKYWDRVLYDSVVGVVVTGLAHMHNTGEIFAADTSTDTLRVLPPSGAGPGIQYYIKF